MREQLACVAVLCAVGAHWQAGAQARLARARFVGDVDSPSQSTFQPLLANDVRRWGKHPPGAPWKEESTWDWSWRDLQGLPSIGPRRAAIIVEARHFDAYARALDGPIPARGAWAQPSRPVAGPRSEPDPTERGGVARAWRSMGPELLDLLPGIGPATVEALRLHWRAQPEGTERQAAVGLGAGVAAPPVEYTPPPARPP